eukprot:838659_1
MMLTSQSRSMHRNEAKSLNYSRQREETKSPEKAELIRQVKSDSSILSERALKIKKNQNKTDEIDAVLLKHDGSSVQIKCVTTSKQVNEILNGRPTIIGEYEDIGVIIIRSLNQSNYNEEKEELNTHILPAPFCNKHFYGNYLLFRIDSTGNVCNFSLKEYEQFVYKNRDSTEKILKNTNNYNSVDNVEISKKSQFVSFDSSYIRTEIAEKIRSEFKSEDGRNPTNSEIEKSIQNELENLVNKLASDKMADPDYDPEDDQDEDYNPDEDEDEDENDDWRIQLHGALKYIRNKAISDGGMLAEKICETFSELYGVEPTLNELTEMFKRIKSEILKNEKKKMKEQRQKNNQNEKKDLKNYTQIKRKNLKSIQIQLTTN